MNKRRRPRKTFFQKVSGERIELLLKLYWRNFEKVRSATIEELAKSLKKEEYEIQTHIDYMLDRQLVKKVDISISRGYSYNKQERFMISSNGIDRIEYVDMEREMSEFANTFKNMQPQKSISGGIS